MKILVGAIAAVALAGAVLAAVLNRAPRPDADVRVIAHGEEVDLAAHLAPGKYTVVDFYAIWCPPCRVLSPALERLAARHPEALAIRKVDIVDWTQPVAEQHGVESLPYLVLYDGDGAAIARGEEVIAALAGLFGDSAREVIEVSGIEPARAPR